MKSEDEVKAEIARRVSQYRILMKSGSGYDEQADEENRAVAEGCKAELESIQAFIFGK